MYIYINAFSNTTSGVKNIGILIEALAKVNTYMCIYIFIGEYMYTDVFICIHILSNIHGYLYL
jgi:hypothetical protein